MADTAENVVVDVKQLKSTQNGMSRNKSVAESMASDASEGTALTRKGMRIVFKDLTYTVKHHTTKDDVALLKNVSGFFNPGQMAALMGPSGSGKTTLLDVLAGRKTVGKLEGTLTFAGTKATPMFLRRYTGYVEQFDTLIDTLTVHEMLMYTAELKREQSEPIDEKKEAVEELIDQLALNTCRDVRIGSSMARGISGGQAKRVNIGIALITNPRVLFLDEPTSGLDSYTANEVMTVVKALVQNGITICATIHSPTPYAFRLFDRLIMLLRGRVIYFGDNGDQAITFFKDSSPDVEALGEGENEAEWIVDITTNGDRQGKASEFADVFDKCDVKAAADRQVEEYMHQGSIISETTMKELMVTRPTVTSFWWALTTMFKYRTSTNYKDGAWLGPRVGDKLIFSLLIMSLYWGIGDDFSQNNVINIVAILFMWCTLPAFGAASYVPSLVLERPLFVRERNDGLYRVITYLCFKITEELIIALIASLIFSVVVWFPIQLQGEWVLFWLVYLCTLSNGIVLAYTVASLSPNMDVANAALPAYVVTLLFFAGFLLRWDDIPKYWIWYAYIDFLHYAWGALTINQFEGVSQAVIGEQQVLQYYSLDDFSKWVYLVIEFCFFLFFFMCAWASLQFKKHQKR